MRNSVLSYFEDTVLKYPEKEAVVDEKESVTFSELKKWAGAIAGKIKEKGSLKNTPILVYLPKGWQSIAAFLGVLYSENFYTPTDVKFPFEKVNSVIKQLCPQLIITDNEHINMLLKNGIREDIIINIDSVSAKDFTYEPDYSQIIDTDVVYILFTSGSTGVPKGVTICNRSIIDYIDWAKQCYQITENDKIGNQAPFYFDNSTLDIYLMISTGATLYIVPEICYAFPAKLMRYICENNINMIFWVPSVLINVANSKLLEKIDCRCLNKILFAGEVMPNRHLNYWRKNIPDALYSNLYGPTEITVDCTYYIVDRLFQDDEPLPIGIPCKNTDVFILDDKDCLIEDCNRTGELCVRGSSLALGYWNNLEKTNEVFTQNPLNHSYPEKIYRTGDMVYYNDKKEIMFSGRKDFQIKHMGYRIELGEIETAAGSIVQLENVCVCYDEEDKKIIMFYIVNEDITQKEIREKLLGIIPKYMVPTIYYKVVEFTYTANGKINKRDMLDKYKREKLTRRG